MDLEFRGELWYWRGPAPFHFLSLPVEVTAGLRAMSALVSYGWGMIPVTARIGTSEWTTALFLKDGRYVLPVKDAVRRAQGLAIGDDVATRVSVRH